MSPAALTSTIFPLLIGMLSAGGYPGSLESSFLIPSFISVVVSSPSTNAISKDSSVLFPSSSVFVASVLGCCFRSVIYWRVFVFFYFWRVSVPVGVFGGIKGGGGVVPSSNGVQFFIFVVERVVFLGGSVFLLRGLQGVLLLRVVLHALRYFYVGFRQAGSPWSLCRLQCRGLIFLFRGYFQFKGRLICLSGVGGLCFFRVHSLPLSGVSRALLRAPSPTLCLS